MATQTVENFIASQREALTTRRTETHTRLLTVQAELDAIDRELLAIDTYEAARNGKPKRAASTKTTGKRSQLFQLIKDSGGITRADILDRMGAKGDKAGEQSISNALAALKNQKKITVQDGTYRAS